MASSDPRAGGGEVECCGVGDRVFLGNEEDGPTAGVTVERAWNVENVNAGLCT